MRFALVDRRLFLRKTAAVFALTLAVVPLTQFEDGVPASIYVAGLVALHVFVLGIYCYRVRFRELDPDTRSLGARVAALVAMGYLLFAVADFGSEGDVAILAAQMLGIAVLHTGVLALLMTRVDYAAPTPAPERASTTVDAG